MDTIAELGRLKTLGDLIEYLKLFDPSMSRAQLAALVPEVTSHDKHHVSKALVIGWDKGRNRIYPQQVKAIERIATETMQTDNAMIRKDFAIHIVIGTRRWHVSAYAPCARCHKPFRISRESSRRCAKCIKKASGKKNHG